MSTAHRASRLDMIQLTGTGAKVLIWLYFATNAVLAAWTVGAVRTGWLVIPALVLFASACSLLSRDVGDRLSFPVAVFAAAVGPLNALLLSWQLSSAGYQQWYFGAGTVVLFFISLRGRIGFAWIGFIPLAAVVIAWGATTEVGLATALVMTARQVPILVVGTLFAIGLRRTGIAIERLAAFEALRASEEAAGSAGASERRRRLHELDAFATSLLTKLASGSPLNPRDRQRFALAEAALRDGLRARTLVAPDVVAAAREARMRGVEVVLLDDSGHAQISPDELGRATAIISAVLDQAKDGRVTARLLPPGREVLATVVLDGSTYARHEIARLP